MKGDHYKPGAILPGGVMGVWLFCRINCESGCEQTYGQEATDALDATRSTLAAPGKNTGIEW